MQEVPFAPAGRWYRTRSVRPRLGTGSFPSVQATDGGFESRSMTLRSKKLAQSVLPSHQVMSAALPQAMSRRLFRRWLRRYRRGATHLQLSLEITDCWRMSKEGEVTVSRVIVCMAMTEMAS